MQLDKKSHPSSQLEKIEKSFIQFVERGLNLDLSRGNPAPEQLALAQELLDMPSSQDFVAQNGVDCRGYAGGVFGIPDAKKLFAPLLGADPDQVMVAGNSSLALMHDALTFAYLHGVPGSEKPWRKGEVTFLCPAPGYDRHFKICAALGINMIPVTINEDGPDMCVVEHLAQDPDVKGMICVPQYSNPTGVTYSDDVVQRIAAMETAAPDFRVIWDNAYAVHDLEDDNHQRVASLINACQKTGNSNRPLVFASTSKITLPGAGIALFASSDENLAWFAEHISRRTIGPNKINQLRHVRFLKDMGGIMKHMASHRALLKPKFNCVIETLEHHLGGKNLVVWSRPKGGYFINIDLINGGAHQVVALAEKAGIRLTPAGETYPYGDDPDDRNLRIGPSGGTLEELQLAAEGLSLAIELVALDSPLVGDL